MALDDTVKDEARHIGRLNYKKIALTATAALFLASSYFVARAAGVPLPPQTKQEQQYQKPEQTIPTVIVPTPIDKLATIRQYQPELADLIAKQPWIKDGINKDEERFILGLEYRLSTSKISYSYTSDKVIIEGKERDIAVLYQPGLEKVAQDSVKYIKAMLPEIQEFFGIPVNWSLLSIELEKVEGGEVLVAMDSEVGL